MNWLQYFLSPMVLPCYLFLATVPSRWNTIRTTGMPGRYQAQQYYKYEEMIKKLFILLLMVYSVTQLFQSGSSIDTATVSEPDQIDSTVERVNQNHEGPSKYVSLVQSVTYLLAFVITTMQEQRRITDAWFSQPLMWMLSLIFGMLSPWMNSTIGEDPAVINRENLVEFYPMMLYVCLTFVSGLQIFN